VLKRFAFHQVIRYVVRFICANFNACTTIHPCHTCVQDWYGSIRSFA